MRRRPGGTDFSGPGLQLVVGAGSKCDMSTGLGQRGGGGETDATAGTADEGAFAVKTEVYGAGEHA